MIERIKKLQATLKEVTDYADLYPPDLVKVKPDPKAFSANEIVYHLLEVEELWQRRLHQLLHSEDKHFMQIDPDALAKEHRYNQQSYAEGIAAWRAAREETIDLLEAMTEDEIRIVGIHSRYGEMDTYRIVEIIADHDLQHLKQMQRTFDQVR
ncbi:MAG: DinB family protein [Ignavibacteriota bacterium]